MFDFCLLVISIAVFFGIIAGENMWIVIALYWAVLVAKNAAAFFRRILRRADNGVQD